MQNFTVCLYYTGMNIGLEDCQDQTFVSLML